MAADIWPGDKVQITYEGEVVRLMSRAKDVLVQVKRSDDVVVNVNARFVTVTTPAYRSGEYYMDELGYVYKRQIDHWETFGGVRVEDDKMQKPLRKLIPEDGE